MRHLWSAALLAALVIGSGARSGAFAANPKDKDWGPEVKTWIGQLDDKDARVRYQAIAGLAKAGPQARDAIPALEKMQQDKDPHKQALAAYALAYIKPDTTSKSSAEDLIAVIKDKDKAPASRSVAAGHLAKQGAPAAKAAYDELLVLLKNENDAYGRALAAYALPYLKPNAPDSANPLAQALKDKNKDVARTAASSLAEVLGKNAGAAAPIIVTVLDEKETKDAYNRALAAYVLGQIKPDNAVAVPALIKALKDPNPKVQDAAKASLKILDPQAAKREGI